MTNTSKGLQAHPAVEKVKDFSSSASLRETVLEDFIHVVMIKVKLSTYDQG